MDDLIDRDDNPELGRKLGLSRRQLLAATTGMAAAAALGAAAFGGGPAHAATRGAAAAAASGAVKAGGNGVLLPPGKRGIILYTVRDAISRDPNTTDLAVGLQGGVPGTLPDRIQADRVRGLRPARQRRGRATSTTSRAPSCCAPGSTTTGSRPRATTATSRRRSPTPRSPRSTRLRDREHPRHSGHIGTGNDPTGSAFVADWEARGRAVELLRRARSVARPEAVHAQPRHRVQLPARQRPARRAGPPDPLVRHPSTGVLPGEHRPELRLPRDGHLLGARRAVQAPHLHRARRHLGRRTSSTRPPSSRRRRTRFPLFHAKDGKINPAPPTATTWCRSARATSTTRRSSSASAPRATTTRCGSRTPRPAAAANPGQSLAFAQVSYDNMAALRG